MKRGSRNHATIPAPTTPAGTTGTTPCTSSRSGWGATSSTADSATAIVRGIAFVAGTVSEWSVAAEPVASGWTPGWYHEKRFIGQGAMNVIDPHLRPSPGELRWFGAILGAFFGLLGAFVAWRAESASSGMIVWLLGAGLIVLYYAVRPLRRPLYALWMTAVSPIGWLTTRVLLGAVYYLVVTPMGLVARALGRDALARRFEPTAHTYWIEEKPVSEPARYFRQS